MSIPATAEFLKARTANNVFNWFGVELTPTRNQIAHAVYEMMKTVKDIKEIHIDLQNGDRCYAVICCNIEEKNYAAAVAEFDDAKLTTADLQLTDHV